MKIELDLATGKLVLECPEDRFKEVVSELQVVLPALRASMVQGSESEPQDNPPDDQQRDKANHSKRKRSNRPSESLGQPRRSSSSRVGPKAAIAGLISAGYFKERRLIADVREHLKHKTGTDYKPEELSISLVRLMREKQLDRDQNADGQYEYREHA